MESRSVDQNKLNELMKKGWSWRSSSCGGSGNSGGSVSIDATLTKSGAAADAKATGDEINALSEEIAGLQGGGAAIVDVVELPETDINEDVFYRALTAEFYANQEPREDFSCCVVETLPATGDSVTDASMSYILMYYAIDTGTVAGYAPAQLAAAFGLAEGWYPAEALFQLVNEPYGGIVNGYDEISSEDGITYLLVQNSVKYRNDGVWHDVQGIGWHGIGHMAEKFNVQYNEASGDYSHAEGVRTIASGQAAHSEGIATAARKEASHAEGHLTEASGYYSHAEGFGTVAKGRSQHVQGEYNVVDEAGGSIRGKYLHIVGNGTQGGQRSNAHTLDWDGNAWFAGGIELTSPNGTRYRFTVSDDGTLTATVVTE